MRRWSSLRNSISESENSSVNWTRKRPALGSNAIERNSQLAAFLLLLRASAGSPEAGHSGQDGDGDQHDGANTNPDRRHVKQIGGKHKRGDQNDKTDYVTGER